MRTSFSLGTLFGIELRADWSWLLTFGLVVWYLDAGYFPTNYPEWTVGATLSAAIATSLLFFASILAHELGHSLVSKRLGLPVPRITLVIFGGLAQLEREPERPRDEFLIAAAGPLVSFALALTFGLLAWAGARWFGRRAGLLAAALYLFIPVTWYDSALWGQVDAVGTLVVLAAIVALVEGLDATALGLAMLAVLVKPQDAIGLVVVLPILVRRHLLQVGSGPRPRFGPLLAGLDGRLAGLLRAPGPPRLGLAALHARADELHPEGIAAKVRRGENITIQGAWA